MMIPSAVAYLITFGFSLYFSPMTDNTLLIEGVSRELAAERAARIEGLRYGLSLELIPGASRIRGREEIRFKLSNVDQPVILDFRDLDADGKIINGAIDNVKVNNRLTDGLRQINGHIELPGKNFIKGENVVTLEFETAVAAAGRPIIRFTDREDGAEYLYTLFVPMDASMAFPCFDQPDLKARFKFEAIAPESWTIIGNAEIAGTAASERKGFRRIRFQPTLPISSYLFAFAAGPFKQIAGAGASTQLRLFARQSKLRRAQEEWPEVMKLTREGMKHFVDFFGNKFPFTKYDQVLIPGFAYGGMEHAGATFLREDAILFRAAPTKSDRLGRASLVLHELAHQWFGDLTTMQWFDDLWLKEGFANYMAYHAMASIYDRDEIWKRFYQAHKPVAYNIDSTRGTTPIYQEVKNLKDAKSAYGAIVYQKAPSLLRALSFIIGEDKFRDGVRMFLKEHAYANAGWRDLIGAFEKSSGRELSAWADAWVKRRAMPQIDVDWSCDSNGMIDKFRIKQRNVLNESGTWPIDAQLRLGFDDAPPVLIRASFSSAEATIDEAIGKRCPAYVFANDGDFGYGRFILDARSRRSVIDRIERIADRFHKTMLWGALWDAVREAEMKPLVFIELAIKSLPDETDEELAQSILDRVARAHQRYLSTEPQLGVAPRLESLCFDRMMNSNELGLRITYFRFFRSISTTPAALKQLKEMLSGKIAAPGVEIKPIDRWRIITTLIARGDSEADSLLEIERKRDKSDDSVKQAYIAEAARADSRTKARYFSDYLHNRTVPEDWVEASLWSFNSFNQANLTLSYLKPALEALPQVKRERKIFFTLAWLNAFIGGQTSAEALDKVEEFLRANKLDRDLELKVLEVSDELERTVRIRR